MKATFAALALAFLLLSHAAAQTYQERQAIIKKHYALGQTEFAAGRISTAKAHFQTVLHHQPKHTYAEAYLAKIRLVEKKLVARTLRKELERVVIPKVDLQEATLSDALNFVRLQVETASGGQVKANIVVMAAEETKNKAITLSLREAPATEVLNYLAVLSGTELTYDRVAVVVRDAPPKNAVPQKPRQ